MELTGTIIERFETQHISDKFAKREIMLEVQDGEYTQTIPIEFINKSADKLDGFPVGSYVTIQINLRGRKWTNKDGVDKYFLSCQGWKIDNGGGGQSQQRTPSSSSGSRGRSGVPPADMGGDEDDIPF